MEIEHSVLTIQYKTRAAARSMAPIRNIPLVSLLNMLAPAIIFCKLFVSTSIMQRRHQRAVQEYTVAFSVAFVAKGVQEIENAKKEILITDIRTEPMSHWSHSTSPNCHSPQNAPLFYVFWSVSTPSESLFHESIYHIKIIAGSTCLQKP